MKALVFFLIVAIFLGCRDDKPRENYPVYKVDLDSLDEVSVFDLFSRVEVVPLETSERSRTTSTDWGIHNNRFLILDKEKSLCFCFGSEGKFRYVVDNKARKMKKAQLMPDGSEPVNILKPMAYFYDFRWYYYLPFQNVVYTLNKEGDKKTLYCWDFGMHGDKEWDSPVPSSPSKVLSATIQREWMEKNCDFALSGAKQNDQYIYMVVERLFRKRGLHGKESFAHLFWHKSSGTYKLFDHFAEGVGLHKVTRMNDTCMVALVSYGERDHFVRKEWLDEKNLKRFEEMKEGDNALIIRYHFKRKD